MDKLLIVIAADFSVIVVALVSLWVLLVKIPDATRYAAYTRILLAGLTSYFAAKVAGLLYQPETMRPFEKLGVDPGAAYLNNPGFPSDHALFAAFLVLTICCVARRRRLAIVLAVLTVIMCTARVIALVHTPLDVIGGVLLAIVGGVWYIGLPKSLANHTGAKRKKSVQ